MNITRRSPTCETLEYPRKPPALDLSDLAIEPEQQNSAEHQTYRSTCQSMELCKLWYRKLTSEETRRYISRICPSSSFLLNEGHNPS